jgi:tagatose-1,6-bisphosphate aldolase non-catalytic subunit AgaZ/GatZ
MDIDSDNPLALEIQQEMAAAYFAACKKMVASLEALKACDGADASLRRDKEQIARRAELLEEAAERVYFVVIQREAMNLSGYEEFFTDYDVPSEVRARMGPRKGKTG